MESVVQQRQQIFVEDVALLVRECRELGVERFERVRVELVSQLSIAALERVTSGVFAEYDARAAGADHFRRDDLVRQTILEHAVLMDARLVGERIPADDGFVGLRKHADFMRHHPTGSHDLAWIHLAAE